MSLDRGTDRRDPFWRHGDCIRSVSYTHLDVYKRQVHSHITHLFALVKMAKEQGLEKVYVHCFLDGRDVPPSSGKSYVEQLQAKLDELGTGRIATVMGRYYAMDRDKRWDRVQRAYDAIALGEGIFEEDPAACLLYTSTSSSFWMRKPDTAGR